MKEKQTFGIDVSSQKLNIHCLQGKDYEIANTKEALSEFIQKERLNKDSCIFGAESTGRYHLVCQEALVKKGFEFKLINPILTGKKITSSIRKKKTDINDAKLIAQIIFQGEGRIVTPSQLNVTKRTLLRTQKRIIEQRTSAKVIIQELKRSGSDIKINKAIKSIERLIEKFNTCIENLDELSLAEKEITHEEKLIKSIPGFAKKLSAIVSTEAGDFARFPSANEFKAYVGIDPRVIQSGKTLKTGRITKRGNAHLRSAFYLAAQVARCHDPQLKEFYQKKKSEGKPTRVAIIAVSRKLCERVFAVVKKGTPYEIRESVSPLAHA